MREPLLYKIVRPAITILFKILFHPQIIGKENIPKNGAVVLAGNHTNYLDCLLIISSTNRVVHFLAKNSLLKGLKGPIFKGMGIVPVNRKIHDKNALINAKKLLNDQKLIGIFPEGTINRTDDIIMPFKIGSVKMAHDTDAYIVPFVIKGKYKIFGKSARIEYFEPYKIKDDNLNKENEKLMNIIKMNLMDR